MMNHHHRLRVIPAKAGIHERKPCGWIPAFAGMTILLFVICLFNFTPLAHAGVTPGFGLSPAGTSGTRGCGTSFKVLMSCATDTLNRVVPIIFALALLAILWGLAKTLKSSDAEAERTKGKNIAIYGILALTLMVCTWGVVNYVRNLIDLDMGRPQEPPMNLPSPPSGSLRL